MSGIIEINLNHPAKASPTVLVVGSMLGISTMGLTPEGGVILQACMKSAKLDIKSPKFLFLDLSNFMPAKNAGRSHFQVEDAYQALSATIPNYKNVKTILAVGTSAMSAIRGVDSQVEKYIGKLLIHPDFPKIEVLACYHPTHTKYAETAEQATNIIQSIVSSLKQVSTSAKRKVATVFTKPVPTGPPRQQYVVRTRKQAEWLFSNLEKEQYWSFDFETTSLDYLEAEILCLAVSFKARTGIVLPLVGQHKRAIWSQEDYEFVWNGMKRSLENNSYKIAHNGKYDFQVAFNYGIRVNNYYADTMLMHYLIDENSRHGLEVLIDRYTDAGRYYDAIDIERAKIQKEQKVKKIDFTYDMLPEEMLWEYACYDADVTYEAFLRMSPALEEEKLTDLFYNHFMPLNRLLAKVEFYGMSIDHKVLDDTITLYTEKLKVAHDEIAKDSAVQAYVARKKGDYISTRAAKWSSSKHLQTRNKDKDAYILKGIESCEFNSNSTKQLKELFIDQLGLPVYSETKKGAPQFNAEALDYYATQVAAAAAMARYSKLSTIFTTFMIGVRDRIRKDGKLHTSFNQHVAVTGRLSSSNINFQNIPNKTNNSDDAYAVRRSFIADPGCEIIEADYAQAEFRVWAQLTQDPVLIADLRGGIDIHTEIAALGFGVPTSEVTKQQRGAAKTVVFGTLYGRSAISVATQLGITEADAQKIQDALLKRYVAGAAWLENTKKQAARDGYVVGLFGQVRHLGKMVKSGVKKQFNTAMRLAVNSPIQGSASQMTCFGALNIEKAMRQHGLDERHNRIVMLIHDAVVLNTEVQYRDLILQIIKDGMLNPHPLVNVPLGVDIKVGPTWADTKEIE